MQHIFKGKNDLMTIYIESPAYADLVLVQCGQQKLTSSESPTVWKHILVHYVYSGSGIYTLNGKMFPVKAGEAFVFFPNDAVTYVMNAEDPWAYRWVEIGGSAEALFKKAGITRAKPIITDKSDGRMGEALRELVYTAAEGQPVYACMGKLWTFIHHLVMASDGYESGKTQQEKYVHMARDIIRNRYQQKLSVEEIAQQVGLDRTYLNRLFNRFEGMGVQRYMMQCRMKNAIELLKNPYLSINDVGKNVGYDDQFTFSKAFKKYYSVSPLEWRKEEFGKHIYSSK